MVSFTGGRAAPGRGASHAGFLEPVRDPSAFEVVRGKLDFHAVSEEDADVILAHLSRDMRSHDMSILEFDTECRVWKRVGHNAFHLDGFFFRQEIPAPSS